MLKFGVEDLEETKIYVIYVSNLNVPQPVFALTLFESVKAP